MPIMIPHWFKRLDPKEPDDRRLRNKFFIKTAAMLHNPHGNLQNLADDLGITLVSLYHGYSPKRGVITPRMAIRIEEVIGAEKMPMKLLRPDLFI